MVLKSLIVTIGIIFFLLLEFFFPNEKIKFKKKVSRISKNIFFWLVNIGITPIIILMQVRLLVLGLVVKNLNGVRTTAAVKKLGCSNLKTLLEDDKILVSDYDIISELTTFAQRHNSFEAEEGCNDDLAMCLVLFSWLVAQDYFKEMTDNDVRKRIYEEQKNQIEQDMAPFGFILDGLEETTFVESDGTVWHTDEYGDMSYMWDYK